jgi:hypothetical protein
MTKFKLQIRPSDIPKLAKQYGPEQDDGALAAGGRIRSADYERSNVETIFKWKTRRRGISRLRRNGDEEITDALRLAVNAKTERAAIALLTCASPQRRSGGPQPLTRQNRRKRSAAGRVGRERIIVMKSKVGKLARSQAEAEPSKPCTKRNQDGESAAKLLSKRRLFILNEQIYY